MQKSSIILYVIVLIIIGIAIWLFESFTHTITSYELSYSEKLLQEITDTSAVLMKRGITDSICKIEDYAHYIIPSYYNTNSHTLALKETEKALHSLVNKGIIIHAFVTDPFGTILVSYPQKELTGLNLHTDVGETYLFNTAEVSSGKPALRVFMYRYFDRNKTKLKKKYGLLCVLPMYKQWEFIGYIYGIMAPEKVLEKTAYKKLEAIRIMDKKGHIIYQNTVHLSSNETVSASTNILVGNLELRLYTTVNKRKVLVSLQKLKRIATTTILLLITFLLTLLTITIYKDQKHIKHLNQEIEKHTAEMRKTNERLLNLLLLNGELMEAGSIDEIKKVVVFYLGRLVEGIKSIAEATLTKDSRFTLQFIEGRKTKDKVSLCIKDIPSKPAYVDVDMIAADRDLELLRSSGLNHAFLIPLSCTLPEEGWITIITAFTECKIKDIHKLLPHLGMVKNEANLAIAKSKLLEKLRIRAETDHLTGLANRRKFEEVLSIEFERSTRYRRKFSISVTDIDDFKKVNDILGHRRGDKVLTDVAGILKKSVRRIDTVCRYGGDEFAIIFPETEKEESRRIMTRIRKSVEEYAKQNKLPISISFGISSYPEDATDAEKILQIADKKMYKDKRERKASR